MCFVATAREGEQSHGFGGHGIGQASNPEARAGSDAFDHDIVEADADFQAVAWGGEDRGDAAHVAAGFLHGYQIRVFGRQLSDLRRSEVGAVGRRIVVEHAGQRCGVHDRAHVGRHFAPIRTVDIRRQDHQSGGAETLRRARERNRLGGAGGGDAWDHARVFGGGDADLDDLRLLFQAERGAFTERATWYDARAAVVEHQAHLTCQCRAVDL